MVQPSPCERSHSKKKIFGEGGRNSYEASFKLAVIKFAKEFGNRKAARKYSVNECNVRRWISQEQSFKSEDDVLWDDDLPANENFSNSESDEAESDEAQSDSE